MFRSKSLSSKRKIRKYPFITILGVGIILLLVWKLNILSIQKINAEISGADCVTEENIINDLGWRGKNILLADTDKSKKKVMSKYPCIKNIEVQKKIPGGLKIIVSTRNSFAVVAGYSKNTTLSLNSLEASPSSLAALLDWSLPSLSGKQFLADETGFIFREGEDIGLPVLFIPDMVFKVSDQVNSELFRKFAAAVEKFGGLGLTPQDGVGRFQFKLIDDNLLVQTEQKLVLSLSKDIFRQLASLQLILQKAKIDGRKIDSIDLRFDKPVVAFSKP